MWTQSHSLTTTEASATQLWQLFENVNDWPTWDTDLEAAHLDGPFIAGASFTIKPKGGPRVRLELLEVEPRRRFKDLTRFPLATMYGLHTLEPTPEGLKLTTTMTVEGPLGWLWRRLVAQKIADALPEEMQRQVALAKTLSV